MLPILDLEDSQLDNRMMSRPLQPDLVGKILLNTHKYDHAITAL